MCGYHTKMYRKELESTTRERPPLKQSFAERDTMSLIGIASDVILSENSAINNGEKQLKFKSSSCSKTSSKKEKSMDACQSLPSKQRSVKFSKDLIVQEHSITVGDQAWTEGPPLALSWDRLSTSHLDLDEFEMERAGQRRSEPDLRTSGRERWERLRRVAGLSETDLLKTKRIKQHIQHGSFARANRAAPTYFATSTATTAARSRAHRRGCQHSSLRNASW